MSPADLPIPEIGKRLRDGGMTAVEIAQAVLDRIEGRDPAYRAFVTVTPERALADARKADRELAEGRDRGPLHGVPLAFKDFVDTAGIPTQYGSKLWQGHIPQADADVAKSLVDAGAVLVGKLATYEFATVGPSIDTPFPPSRNPWHTGHITGGSSSGSAAAVAGGLLRAAIGTDTGGSIRSPSGYCGVVGLKPTYGRVSKQGVFPLSPSLDHVGPIAATVEEAALVLDAISTQDAWEAAASQIHTPLEGLHIAYARDWFAADPQADPTVIAALDTAVSTLSLLGARIAEVSLPDHRHFEACGAAILHAEAFAIHRQALREQGASMAGKTFQTLLSGVGLTDSDLTYAQRVAAHLRKTLDETVFARFDALVTANTLAPAPPFSAFAGEEAVWTAMRTIGFNVTGHPALALPIGFFGGLPLGMQVVGGHGAEAAICRIGHQFEMATDHTVQPVPMPLPA